MQLARKHHPDTNPDKNAKEKFVEIQEAYDVRHSLFMSSLRNSHVPRSFSRTRRSGQHMTNMGLLLSNRDSIRMPSRVGSAVLREASTTRIFLRCLVEGEPARVVHRQISSKPCLAPSEGRVLQDDKICAGVI